MKHTSVLLALVGDNATTKVTLVTVEGWSVTIEARCDTGAESSSIDAGLVDFLGVEVEDFTVRVRSAAGVQKRDVCRLTFDCEAGSFDASFTITNRARLRYPMLLGRDVLFSDEEE